MYGYIYKTTNIINNKIYIGQHISSTFDSKYLGSGVKFKAALKKYGRANFCCEVLKWCNSLEELNAQEFYWIDYFQSCNPDIGYNIKLGGNNAPHSDIIKQKIGEGNRGKKRSPEYIEKMRQRQLGNHNNGRCNANRITVHLNSTIKFIDPSELEHYQSQGYQVGVPQAKNQKLKDLATQKYSSGSCMHLDSRVKYFSDEEIPTALEQGWVLGRGSYPKKRGQNISAAKKGAIKIIKGNCIKYIQPEQLPLYIEQGFEKASKH